MLEGVIIAILAILVIALSIQAHARKKRGDELAESLSYFKGKYLRKQGGTTYRGLCLNYELLSFDGGKIWYATDLSFWPDKVVILGKAEDIYPGLLEDLDGFSRLADYVSENGSLDPLNPEHLKLLQKAGITVTTGAA